MTGCPGERKFLVKREGGTEGLPDPHALPIQCRKEKPLTLTTCCLSTGSVAFWLKPAAMRRLFLCRAGNRRAEPAPPPKAGGVGGTDEVPLGTAPPPAHLAASGQHVPHRLPGQLPWLPGNRWGQSEPHFQRTRGVSAVLPSTALLNSHHRSRVPSSKPGQGIRCKGC